MSVVPLFARIGESSSIMPKHKEFLAAHDPGLIHPGRTLLRDPVRMLRDLGLLQFLPVVQAKLELLPSI